MPSYIIVSSRDVPVVYITQSQSLEQLIRTAQHKHFYMTVFALEPQQAQTPNPWDGIILKQELVNHPTDLLDDTFLSYCHLLQDLDEPQLEVEVYRAQLQLKAWMENRRSSLKEEKEDTIVLPQVRNDLDNTTPDPASNEPNEGPPHGAEGVQPLSSGVEDHASDVEGAPTPTEGGNK
jgi:hypothetical protein